LHHGSPDPGTGYTHYEAAGGKSPEAFAPFRKFSTDKFPAGRWFF
jgi:hypothetical protein